MSFAASHLIGIVAVAICGLFAAWLSRRPNRVKNTSGRVRMPKVVPFIGWLLVAVGALMTLVAFLSPPDDDTLAMQIASVAILAGGLLFLLAYRNLYFIAEADQVFYRNVFGVEKSIRYGDIVKYRMFEQNNQPMLYIKDSAGTRFTMNPKMYALEPVLAAIGFHQQHGRWPMPGEPRAMPAYENERLRSVVSRQSR